MEFGDDDMPCQHGQDKICSNCANCTKDPTTKKHYCLDVSILRMTILGPRLVAPTNTCAKCVLKNVMAKSR